MFQWNIVSEWKKNREKVREQKTKNKRIQTKTKLPKRFTFQWIIRNKLKSSLNDFEHSHTYQTRQVNNNSNYGQIIHLMSYTAIYTDQQHCFSTFSENRLIRIDGVFLCIRFQFVSFNSICSWLNLTNFISFKWFPVA